MAKSEQSTTVDAFVRQRQAKLDELAAHIEQLEARLKAEDTDSWIKALSHIEGLKQQHEELRQQVEQARAGSHHRWQDVRRGIEKAWSDFEKSLSEARALLKSQGE